LKIPLKTIPRKSSQILGFVDEYRPVVRQLRKTFTGIWFWLPLIAILVPGRIPPRDGILRNWRNSHVINVRLRAGGSLRCSLGEFFSVVEIYGQQVYNCPALNYVEAKTVVDIGANVGFATVWLSHAAPNARIFAVEPDERSAALLRDNVERAGLGNRVEIIVAAVGGNSGSGVFVRSPVSSTRSYVVPNCDTTLPPDGSTVDAPGVVPVLTLAELIAITGTIDVLKIDCEGSEFDFFDSAPLSSLKEIGGIIGEYHLKFGDFETLKGELSPGGFTVSSTSEDESVGIFLATS